MTIVLRGSSSHQTALKPHSYTHMHTDCLSDFNATILLLGGKPESSSVFPRESQMSI